MSVMTVTELDSSALRSTVAFTGRLACMTRAEAFEVVRSHGGTPSQTVTRQTNVLVVGELGWPLLDDGRPSNKLSRAGSYGVPVVSERRFLEWIGKAVPDSWHRTYSADQIAALSKLSSNTIDELVRFGLLDGAVAGVVEIEVGVVSGVFNLESSGVDAPDWRPRHDEH